MPHNPLGKSTQPLPRRTAAPSAICLGLVWLLACAASVRAADEATGLAELEEQAFREAAEAVAPSVVQIRTIGGLEQVEQQLVAAGPTTGLIISEDGYILSSAFNFAQEPTSILIRLPDGQLTPAELIATDRSRMLVLLKVDAPSPLPVPELAPSGEAAVGTWAVAIGRTFEGPQPNVSVGIVSAVNRMFGKVIQTDAAVSAANYGGPLVDLYGRVMGLIVPMSPQESGALAGAEWYDSGIGFAVPLADLANRIEQLKSGEDLHPGLLGVAFADGSAYGSPPTIATVRPHSPADQAEIEPGDQIVAVDGKPIQSKAELRFQLVPRYAGDELRLTIARGDKRSEKLVTLSGPLGAFQHAFLGVLPIRGGPDEGESDGEPDRGIVVRAVYNDSPAAAAGVMPGDRILKINETTIDTVATAIGAMNGVSVGDEVELLILRDDEEQTHTLTAVEMPVNVPADLPPAVVSDGGQRDGPQSAADPVEIKFPEFPNQCRLYIPTSRQGSASGLVIWLQPGEDGDHQTVLDDWKEACDQHNLLLAIPSPLAVPGWTPHDLAYLQRLLRRLMNEYDVDGQRVVVHGRQQAGGMAYLFGLANRGQISGISVAAAVTPRGLDVADAEPSTRVAIHSAQPEQFPLSASVRGGLRDLTKAGYPVTVLTIESEEGHLQDEERGAFLRWIDTLDRF